MAQNMGFGSALTGFGSGYLNALKAGRAEQNSLLSAKLRKDALAQKKQESEAAGQLRALQMQDMLDARAFRRKDSENKANYNNNRLLGTAQGKVTDFYTKMQPYLKAQTPDQRKTTHDSMRTSVRSMLVAGGMDPKLADQQAEQMIKPYGAQLQDEMVDMPYAPNMEKEGLMSSGIIPESSVGTLGSDAPDLGQSTPFSLQKDGTYGRVGRFAMDPTLRNMVGMQEVLKSDPLQLAYNANKGGLKPQEGFSQFAPSAYGATEQRSALTKQVPATATYGMDELTRSQVGKNDASTGLTKVRTQQLVELFPEQQRFFKTRNDNLVSQIKDRGIRTNLAGLGYELDLRKHAAQVAYQQAMTAVAQGNLSNAQKNTALREVGMRIKSIIDPTRIMANTGAIISDLNQALAKPGADKASINKQLARMKQIQEQMMEFRAISTQPDQATNDATTLGRLLSNTLGATPLGQVMGIPNDPYQNRLALLGNLPMQNPWDDPLMSDGDYIDNQYYYGTSPLSEPAMNYQNFNSGGMGFSAPPTARGVRYRLGQ
jgi:hypothetical protein